MSEEHGDSERKRVKRKRILIVTAGLLALILLLYAVLGCLVYCHYEPAIESLIADVEAESSRQDGWDMAIAEIETECRRLGVVLGKDFAAQKRQKERLQQAVKNEKDRQALLRKDLKGRFRWSTEWRNRTEARLVRAQQALDGFKGPQKDAAMEAKIRFLRQQLEALRARKRNFQSIQDRLDRLNERRDRLKIWPLPMLDRFVQEKVTTEK